MTDAELITRLAAVRLELDALLAELYARRPTSSNNGLLRERDAQSPARCCEAPLRKEAGRENR